MNLIQNKENTDCYAYYLTWFAYLLLPISMFFSAAFSTAFMNAFLQINNKKREPVYLC